MPKKNVINDHVEWKTEREYIECMSALPYNSYGKLQRDVNNYCMNSKISKLDKSDEAAKKVKVTDITLQRYVAFIKTVEMHSFSKAAAAMQYSQPAISRMVKSLEDECGVSLLERNSKNVELTSDGLEIFPYIKAICASYDKLADRVCELHGLQAGIVRIGCFSSVSTCWLPDVIKAFKDDYPNISYELLQGDYGEIEGWVAEGRVDCGIVPLPTTLELDSIPLYREEFMAVLPKDHPLAARSKFPVKALCDYPFMLNEKGGESNISRYLHDQGITPNICLTTWDDYAVMRMVEKGMGISILSKLNLERAPYDIIAKPLEHPAYREVALILRDKESTPRIVRKFMEYLPEYSEINGCEGKDS